MSRKYSGGQRGKKGDRLLYNSKLVALACVSVCWADRSAGTCTSYQSRKDRPGFSSQCVCVCVRDGETDKDRQREKGVVLHICECKVWAEVRIEAWLALGIYWLGLDLVNKNKPNQCKGMARELYGSVFEYGEVCQKQ